MIELLTALLIANQPVTTYKEVPDPLTLDFNQCVRIFWTEKGKQLGKTEKEWGRLDPPIAKEDLALLEYYRREAWGILVLCDDKSS